jgi:hypothetical protein
VSHTLNRDVPYKLYLAVVQFHNVGYRKEGGGLNQYLPWEHIDGQRQAYCRWSAEPATSCLELILDGGRLVGRLDRRDSDGYPSDDLVC